MCSEHKIVLITGNNSEAAIIHVCLLLSETSLTVAVIGHFHSPLCISAEDPSFLESSFPFALKHVQTFFQPLWSKACPTSATILPCDTRYPSMGHCGQDCDWAFHSMPPSSCRPCRQTFSALRQGWRVLHASVSPAYQAALTHITWLSLNIPEWEFSSLFLWNKLNAHTGTCRKTSRYVSLLLLILTVI